MATIAAVMAAAAADDDDSGPAIKAETVIMWILVGMASAIAAIGLLGICCEVNFCGIPWLIKTICKGIFWAIKTIIMNIMFLIAAAVLGSAKAAIWVYNKAEAGVRVLFCLPPRKKKAKNNNNQSDPEMGNVQHNVGFAERANGAGLLPNLRKPAPAVVASPKNALKERVRPIKPIQAPGRGILGSPPLAYLAVNRENAYRARQRSAEIPRGPVAGQAPAAAAPAQNNNNQNNNEVIGQTQEENLALPDSDNESDSPPPLADGDDESLLSIAVRQDGRAHSL